MLVIFITDILVRALVLWIALKIMRMDSEFKDVALVCLLSSLCLFIPVGGKIISSIMYFYLMHKYLGVRFWPDAILVGAISFAVIVFSVIGISSFLS